MPTTPQSPEETGHPTLPGHAQNGSGRAKGWKLGLGHVPPAERTEAREQYLTREELRN